MILFSKLRYKNFLSSGNNFTEIELNKNKSTLVVGQNGAGKSTMLDALSFALFGKAHRNINKMQLVNSINNKACMVEVEFAIGSNQFKVSRGIKPNVFEIWKNGTLINQSSHSKEYQKILEQNILKLNHKSFHQVVVLGSSSFIPFMQLPGGHRREVIEDLLDINVFSKMNIILKERNTLLKEKIGNINYDIDIVKTKIDGQRKYIRDVNDLIGQNISKKKNDIAQYQSEIAELQQSNTTLSAHVEAKQNPIKDELSTLNSKKQALLQYTAQFKQQMTTVAKDAKFYETNEECPTCSQDISPKLREEKLTFAKSKAKELKSAMDRAAIESTAIEQSIERANDSFSEIREKQSEIHSNNQTINRLQTHIQSLESDLTGPESADLEKAKKDLSEFEDNRSNLLEQKMKYSEEFSYNSVIVEMLKDTGIKTKIIKQYLPVMNKLVNQYLQILDFFVHFHLDESFQEVIRSRHRDEFTYDSFSEGEKQRIDLALLFTWRQVAKMKNSVATNLLLLDETFDSSLDHDGVENLLKILYTLGDDTNVFVISHKGEILDGKFNNKLEFIKEKNFSKMKNNSVQANELVL
jgi:DNA repair exonuclease SbcCD ATPase subunit